MANQQRQVRAYARQKEALALRLAGVHYDVIAERLHYKDRSGAYRAVASALKKTLQEPADDLRRLELERLDVLMLGLMPMARRGEVQSVDRVLRIMERRAKLLGLDAPVQTEELGDKDTAYVVEFVYGPPPPVRDKAGDA